MAANLPTFLLNATLVATRAGEAPAADFDGGMNRGGSCTGGVGINTGDYDPKAQDWPRIADTAARESQHIGTATSVINADQDPDFNDTVAFVQTIADIAPDGTLDITTGAVNKTGKTVPTGSWAWGVIAVA
jgi:hypothetical protein